MNRLHWAESRRRQRGEKCLSDKEREREKERNRERERKKRVKGGSVDAEVGYCADKSTLFFFLSFFFRKKNFFLLSPFLLFLTAAMCLISDVICSRPQAEAAQGGG